MGRILSISQIPKTIKKIKRDKKTIVVVGGCFDILHPGHVIFLEKAKKEGDILIVLLESDEKVRKLKGIGRPIHNQKERAMVLKSLKCVDYVIPLPNIYKEQDYDLLIQKINPDIIAATKGYKNLGYIKRVSKITGAKVKYVTKIVGNHSSTRILKLGSRQSG